MNNMKINFKGRTYFRFIIAIALIAMPIMLVWHAELLMLCYKLHTTTTFTNGFVSADGEKVYHIFMYLTGLVIGVAAFVLMWDELHFGGLGK